MFATSFFVPVLFSFAAILLEFRAPEETAWSSSEKSDAGRNQSLGKPCCYIISEGTSSQELILEVNLA